MKKTITLKRPVNYEETVFTEITLDSDAMLGKHIKHLSDKDFINPSIEPFIGVVSRMLDIPPNVLLSAHTSDVIQLYVTVKRFLQDGLDTPDESFCS